MRTYLYVIAPENDPKACKIGFSKNPERRTKDFQTGHPEKLKLYYKEEFDNERIKLFEKILHNTLRHLKIQGEWFNISPKDAELELVHIKIRYEDEKHLNIYI